MTITKQTILNRLADEVGKPLARMANPSYWSFEQQEQAARYVRLRDAARVCYRRIDGGQDPVACLRDLKKIISTGIECNALCNMIEEYA